MSGDDDIKNEDMKCPEIKVEGSINDNVGNGHT